MLNLDFKFTHRARDIPARGGGARKRGASNNAAPSSYRNISHARSVPSEQSTKDDRYIMLKSSCSIIDSLIDERYIAVLITVILQSS